MQEKKQSNVDKLKNALLTLSMRRVFKDDCEKGPVATVFDGSKLPPLSGSDMSNACFSYIIDENEFRKSPWYTQAMAKKHEAIHKFIEKRLSTQEQVTEYFDRVIKIMDSKKEE